MDPNSKSILMSSSGGPSGPEYIGTYKFQTPQSYPNNTYVWTVPAQTEYIQAIAWGSGGEGYEGLAIFCSIFGNATYCKGGMGGCGGYATAVIPVTAGEQLSIYVGTAPNDGDSLTSTSPTVPPGGGGFTGVIRGNTPLLIAGGGGGAGQTTATRTSGMGRANADGGNGGGDPAGGTLSNSYGNSGTYLVGGSPNGGHGYQGGDGGSYQRGGEGGTGYISASGNLHASQITSPYFPPDVPNSSSTNPDYVWPHGRHGSLRNEGWKSGLLVLHLLGGGYNPVAAPVIPNPRTILATI